MFTFDNKWHLANTDDESKITEFELQLWRVFYGFLRWQEECEKSANGFDISGNDLAILHVIRMKNRQKTIYDIARLLNRDDTFNIQYGIKKLLKMGLIKKAISKNGNKKTNTYEITEVGVIDTDKYVSLKNNILVDIFKQDPSLNLEDMAKNLARIKAIYDEGYRVATSYSYVDGTPSS